MMRWQGAGRADYRDRTQARGRERRRVEKDLDQRVGEALDSLGFKVSRFQQPRATKQTAGIPDLYALHPGWQLAVWVELKALRGTLSAAQEQWHATARAAGQTVLVVRSVADLVAGLAAAGAPLRDV